MEVLGTDKLTITLSRYSAMLYSSPIAQKANIVNKVDGAIRMGRICRSKANNYFIVEYYIGKDEWKFSQTLKY